MGCFVIQRCTLKIKSTRWCSTNSSVPTVVFYGPVGRGVVYGSSCPTRGIAFTDATPFWSNLTQRACHLPASVQRHARLKGRIDPFRPIVRVQSGKRFPTSKRIAPLHRYTATGAYTRAHQAVSRTLRPIVRECCADVIHLSRTWKRVCTRNRIVSE